MIIEKCRNLAELWLVFGGGFSLSPLHIESLIKALMNGFNRMLWNCRCELDQIAKIRKIPRRRNESTNARKRSSDCEEKFSKMSRKITKFSTMVAYEDV